MFEPRLSRFGIATQEIIVSLVIVHQIGMQTPALTAYWSKCVDNDYLRVAYISLHYAIKTNYKQSGSPSSPQNLHV